MKKLVLATFTICIILLAIVLYKLKDLDQTALKKKELEIKKIDSEILNLQLELDNQNTKEQELKNNNNEQIAVLESWKKELEKIQKNL